MLVDKLISNFPKISSSVGIQIHAGERFVFKTDNNTVIKVARTEGAIVSSVNELYLWSTAQSENGRFFCPVIGASAIDNIVLIEMPCIQTPVSQIEVESSDLWGRLIYQTDCNDFGFQGKNYLVTDLIADEEGNWHNLGLATNGEVIILDYGDAQVKNFSSSIEVDRWLRRLNLF